MDAFDVADWRRLVFALYAEVRAQPDPAAGHQRWRQRRDELVASHPATPLLPEDRDGFAGLTVLPLRDGGCGRPGGGYGGGRYLLDTVKGAFLGGHGSRLVVDLNFAYAPSCAYNPAWAYPLPPPGNRVDTVVPVGELQPHVESGAAAPTSQA